MLLSESEKNRIKGLHGLIKEAENVPPDESVFVANKNPFKDDKFKNARSTYKSDMSDGNMFFILDEKVVKKIIEDYYNSNLKNKSFRAGTYGTDEIFTFNEFGITELNWLFVPDSILFKTLRTKEEYLETKSGNKFQGYYEFLTYPSFKFKIKNTEFYYMYRSDNKPSYEIFKLIPQNQIDVFEKMFRDNLSAKTLPDEVFEIRRIQRKQTDF